MLSVLAEVERHLPELLSEREAWSSLDVDYHPPRVERLYRAWGDYRINLHCIHPCEEGAALFHPHPWPSAMWVISGCYEMAIGLGPGEQPPPVAARLIAVAPMRYEMTHEDGWHWVRPIGGLVWTLMVSGRPWNRRGPDPKRALPRLEEARVREMLAHIRSTIAEIAADRRP